MAFMLPQYEQRRRGFYARLSAPGYLDCTIWEGPFESLAQAREWVEEYFEVDADTGESLDDPE